MSNYLNCAWLEQTANVWLTGCGWNVYAERNNDMKFCCYCGKPLALIVKNKDHHQAPEEKTRKERDVATH